MKLQGTHTFQVPRERVWAVLMNPEAIARVMPGCDKLEEVAPDTYQTTLKIGIAAVKGTYNGSIKLVDKTAPVHYRVLVEGNGSAGFVRGEATIDLEARAGTTVLTYEADTQVGGLIANIGQRMISGVAKMLLTQAIKRLEEELAQQ